MRGVSRSGGFRTVKRDLWVSCEPLDQKNITVVIKRRGEQHHLG